jgi:hypothetical protein
VQTRPISKFKENLNTAFLPYDRPGDALEEMKSMRLGTRSMENHVANFKLAVTQSGLDKDSAAVIDYFRESLTIPLQKWIMTIEDPPTTLEDWCKWALKMDANYKKMQQVIGRSWQGTSPTEKKKEEQTCRWHSIAFYFPWKERDPNAAMDIDTINTDAWSEAMRKGLTRTHQHQLPQETEKQLESTSSIPEKDKQTGNLLLT